MWSLSYCLNSTRKIDKREKKQIYQDRLRVPEYFWYDPFDPEDWAGFALRDGVYEELRRDAQDRFISRRLELAMVPWPGVYKGVETLWLRWETLNGELVLTGQDDGRTTGRMLGKELRALGVDPNDIE